MTNYICQKCNKPFTIITDGRYIPKHCSRSCANSRIKTEESKNKLSAKMQGIGKFTKILFCKCEICSTEFLWNSIDKGYRRCCKDLLCIKQFRYNVLKGKVGGFKPNSTRVHRSVYKGYQMDSGAELAFAQLLDKHNIEWIKNSSIAFEYLPGKKYYPDFYLPSFDAWVEIKGKKYVRQDDNLRWTSVPGLEVIWSTDIKLPAIMAGMMGVEPT